MTTRRTYEVAHTKGYRRAGQAVRMARHRLRAEDRRTIGPAVEQGRIDDMIDADYRAIEAAGGSRNPRIQRYYHVTTREDANDILANGFFPGWGDVGFGVYFYGSPESARAYAARGGWDKSLLGEHVVILDVEDERIRKILNHELDAAWDKSKYSDMYVLDVDEADDGHLKVDRARLYLDLGRAAVGSRNPRLQTKAVARENFLGFFKSAPPEQVFDLAAHAQTAEGLARRAPRVEHYLVHAPGRNGRGRAWYWLSSLGLRGFEDAKAHGAPVSYISSSSPWNQVRSNIGMYRGGDRIPFVVIDTFSETVEGPLTLAQIQARQNPRSLARRNGATGVAVAVAENLMQQLQGLKVASQIAHWNARGPQGYSDHLLYERIYEKIDKQIDTLAEKYVAYFQRPVPAQAMMPPQDFALWYGEESITPESLAQHVNNARALSDALRSAVNEAGRYQDVQGSVAGFDDYLMSLNNKLDTFYYLLTSVRGA